MKTKFALALALATSSLMAASPMKYLKSFQYSVGASATQQNFKLSYDNPHINDHSKKSGSKTNYTGDLSIRKEVMPCTSVGVLFSLSSKASHGDYWNDLPGTRQKMILGNDFGYYASLGRRFTLTQAISGDLSILAGGRTMYVKGEQRNNATKQTWHFAGKSNTVFSYGLNLELTVAKSKIRPFVRWTSTNEVKTKLSAIGSTKKDERLRSKLNTFYFGARYAF